MAREFSAEEKLLRLIKKKKKNETPASEGEAPESAPKKEEAVNHREKKSSPLLQLLDVNNIVKLEHVNILNNVLFIMLIVVLVYLLVDIFVIPPKGIGILEGETAEGVREPMEEPEVKPYSYYSKALAGKNVFEPLIKEERAPSEPEVPVEELMGNLTLLGIVSGENPQAIIEDKAQNKTFFLREGQSAGGILLKKINGEDVTVIYKGEEFNLTM